MKFFSLVVVTILSAIPSHAQWEENSVYARDGGEAMDNMLEAREAYYDTVEEVQVLQARGVRSHDSADASSF